MALISKNEFDRLVKVAWKQTRANNVYLKDECNSNFDWIKKEYFNNKVEDTKLFNTGSGLFGSIASTVSAFVGNPSFGYDLNLSDWVNDYVSTGYCAFVLYKENGEYGIRREDPESVSYENGILRVFKIYEKPVVTGWSNLVGSATTKQDLYILVQTYSAGKIENELYKTKSFVSITSTTGIEKVGLDSIFETSSLKDVELTGLEVPSLFIVKEKCGIPLAKLVSMLDTVENSVYSIDRRVVMFDTQFLKNTENFILLKNITLPRKTLEKYNDGKEINFNNLWRVLTTTDDGSIEFVANKNELIDTAIKYEDVQIRRISSQTTIPTDFLGLDNAHGAIGEGSRSLLHSAFIKTIENIRDRFAEWLEPIIEIMQKDDPEFDWTLTRWSVFSVDTKALVDELKVARDSSLISQKRAVMTYLNLDEDEAMEEIAEIDAEKKANAVIDPMNPNPAVDEKGNPIDPNAKDNNALDNNTQKDKQTLDNGTDLPNK